VKDIKQQGFSSLELLIILCVVFIAFLVGWYVWHSNQSAPISKSTTSNQSSSPITYYNGIQCAKGGAGQCPISTDSVNADIKVLGQVPADQAAGSIKINAAVTKIVSYKRYRHATYPLIQAGQPLTLILDSSALISSTWPTSCSNSPQGSSCNDGILVIDALPPSQAATFIQGLQNKVVSAKLSCTSSCDGNITGLAN
jgi:hypothetical protein